MDGVPAYVADEVKLSDSDLARIARLVHARSGITLHNGKRALVLARLQKRLRSGGFSSFRDYLGYVESDKSGAELTALLDAIATNHTASSGSRSISSSCGRGSCQGWPTRQSGSGARRARPEKNL